MKPLLLALTFCLACAAYGQRKCGIEASRAYLLAKDSSWAGRIEQQRQSLQGIADAYKKQHASSAARATTASAIPVIFHILVTHGQFDSLGGAAGIEQRCDSQIAVLNRDYNAQNTDNVLIPSGWTHLYGNAGIHFGLAHTNPYGGGSTGCEIQLVADSPGGFQNWHNSYSSAKHLSTGGLDAWDETKYLNVWCLNFVDYQGLLGITVAPSFVGTSGYPSNEVGVCIYWETLGKRASASDYYPPTGWASDYYDLGRTLTHEIGHYFEIWHTWGDDGGLCPWNGGRDDGLADTPPESNDKYWNYADTIPGGTFFDDCQYNGSNDTQATLYGVASLDFMNYTDDIGMHMFTTDQAAVMASMVEPGSQSYSLTQNPGLTEWSPLTGVASVVNAADLSISPNPSTGIINISVNTQNSPLQQITVTNILGQDVWNQNISPTNFYSIDLSAMNKGIYFVRCNFAIGSITRKILLQ